MRESSSYRHLQVSPIAGALGAEVKGVDLAQPLAPEIIEEIRQALLAHLVIFFPCQQLGPAELLTFAGQFGQPTEYPQLKGLPGNPHVIAVAKLEHEKVNFGGVWRHSDTTYLRHIRRWGAAFYCGQGGSPLRGRYSFRQPVSGL